VVEPIWIEIEETLIYHERQLAEHTGSSGIRDRGLLESALAKPKNIYATEEASPHRLAACYAFGIASNHPFVDSNKRTALVVSFTFLDLNGMVVTASPEDRYLTFLALASGELDELELAGWFSEHAKSRVEPDPA
jgi:death-on-curing protein